MKSFDIKLGEQKTASEKSLLELYTVGLTIKNIGVAFPLSLARDLQMPRSGSQDDSAVRAFLFSIKTLEFDTQLGENGQASMTGFSFQFVSRYDASLFCRSWWHGSLRNTGSNKEALPISQARTTRLATGSYIQR